MIKKLLLSVLVSSALCITAYAQDRTVTGTVTSAEDGMPVPGANVVVQGTTKGTATDADGRYSIQLAPGENVLVYSFVGFTPVTVTVGERSVVDVTLQADVTNLNEVVVIGYGTQEQRDLTSAITTVKADEIQKTPTSQAMQALQGRVAGLQVVSRGEPGESPTVRIRGVGALQGDGAPLYVVDGMFFDNIDFLNTADIATISVMKDASAKAIYGVRASNGVVLIETRSGSYRQAPRITYDGYYGVQVPQNVLKVANAEQFSQYVRETGAAADLAFLNAAFARYGRSRINPDVPAVNTDWYDEVLVDSSPIQNHSIGIDGGGEGVRYSVGASYFRQDGLLKYTRNSYERMNFRAKVDFDAADWLNVGGNAIISSADRFLGDNAVWFQTYFAVPILPVYDDLNTASTDLLSNAKILGYRNPQNPLYNLFYNDHRYKVGKLLGNFHAEFKIIPDKLSFRTTYNYRLESINERLMNMYYHDGLSPRQSAIRKENTTTLNTIWDNVLTYNNTFSDVHDLTVMAGYSFRNEGFDRLYARGTELLGNPGRSEEYLWYIDRAQVIDAGGTGDDANRIYGGSYFGRVAYSYDDRYLFYSTVRRDGTSKFQKRWGFFPTFGAGWVISEEGFFDADFVDFLKIRAGWGKLGNETSDQAIGAPTLVPTETAIDDERIAGYRVEPTYDLLDQWETAIETNIGLSGVFLNDRLSLEADYYVRKTDNAVVTITLPLIREQIRRNRGVIQNTGIEVALNWSDNLSNGLSYTIGGNFATLKNEVLNLGGQPYLDAGTAEFRQRSIIGEPIRAFYGYEVVGVFQNDAQIQSSGYTSEFIAERGLVPGDFFYKDQNNDGVIDDQDRVVLGSFLPSLTYGFNLGVSFKNFNLTANFQGQSGHSILNRKRGEIIFTTDTNIDAELAKNLWRGDGTSNKYPSAAGLRKGWNQAMSDYFVEDGSYFRIQNVRLAYSLVNRQLFGANMPETTVSFTAERPLTVFSYNGFNPEVPDGVDRQTYPIPGVYTLGLNVRF